MDDDTGSPIVLGALLPHPPLLVPEIGGGDLRRVRKTQEATRRVGALVSEASPDVLVLISPHAPLARDAITILACKELKGDFGAFGAAQVSFSFENDLKLVGEITRKAKEVGVATFELETARSLDHGTLVPLYYIREAGVDVPLVVMGFSFISPLELYAFGRAVQSALRALGRHGCVVASGDLSHRLLPGAPAGYHPQGEVFDRQIMSQLHSMDIRGILETDPVLLENAGECGYRSIVILLGTLDGFEVRSEVLSYEGPFGVGYGICVFFPGERSRHRELLGKLLGEREEIIRELRGRESAPVRLARQAVEAYVLHGRVIDPPAELPVELSGRAGVFCSIKKHGELRGCIGTIQPVEENIAREVIRNAIAAACEDPRFSPVEPHELGDLVYSVDILSPPERVSSISDLDPKRYGVIVKRGARRGLLLPDLEGIDDVETQVEIARRKAGIGSTEEVELYRFEVTRYR